MSTNMWILLVVVAVAVAGLLAWVIASSRRTGKLRRQFGPEYDHVVQETGDRRRAEARLAERQDRIEHLHVHPLSPNDRSRFLDSWRLVQSSFVDDPRAAIGKADQLTREVMVARGYPVGDFEQRSADISVNHPNVVQNYRAAREIAQRNQRGEASTEDLRQALVYYRDLFEELLEATPAEHVEVNR